MTAPPPISEDLEPPLSYATQACLAVDSSQPQSRHQSLLGQLKRNVLNRWRPVQKCFLSNIPCIPYYYLQAFIALKISKDFVNPHTAMVNYDKLILHLFSCTEDSSHLAIVNDNFFHQIVVTCLWVLKMVVFRIHSYAPLPSITTTVDRLTQGSTDDGTGVREGPGAQRGETDVSGCRWILARFRQCSVSPLREDRTQLNGLRVIIYPTVEMATSSLLTGKAGVRG